MALGRRNSPTETSTLANSMEETVEFVLPLGNLPMPGRGWLEESTLVGQDTWLYHGLSEALKGTNMVLSLEYNGVDLNVAGYPEGVVAPWTL